MLGPRFLRSPVGCLAAPLNANGSLQLCHSCLKLLAMNFRERIIGGDLSPTRLPAGINEAINVRAPGICQLSEPVFNFLHRLSKSSVARPHQMIDTNGFSGLDAIDWRQFAVGQLLACDFVIGHAVAHPGSRSIELRSHQVSYQPNGGAGQPGGHARRPAQLVYSVTHVRDFLPNPKI